MLQTIYKSKEKGLKKNQNPEKSFQKWRLLTSGDLPDNGQRLT